MHWVASKVFVGLHSLRDGYIQWERLGIDYEYMQRYSCIPMLYLGNEREFPIMHT